MDEYDKAINSIQEGRPEITNEEIDKLVAEKLEKIGNGFLTKRGAIHLVAADLGVTLPKATNPVISLKEAHDGDKDVSVRTKVMNISPVKEFTGKDGNPGAIRTMTVYDNSSSMGVKLWNDKASLPEIDKIKPGDMVRIIKAYVKADLTGAPAINIGSGSTLVRDDDQETDIGGLERLEVDASSVTEDGRNMVVVGKVYGQISDSEFKRKTDGKPGTILRMSISGKDGSTLRVVLWGKTKRDIPKYIPLEAHVRIIGADARGGNQGLEIHGNDATILEIDGTNDTVPKIIRIVSKVAGEHGSMVLGVDAKSEYAFISDTAKITANFEVGDVVELMPTNVFGSSVILDTASFAHKPDGTDKGIPTLEKLQTSIESVRAGSTYSIKAIVLKVEERRDIQTKAGNTVTLAEMYVEDNTGPIWVKGWRVQSDMITKCTPGEIYEITGLNARAGLEGKVDLTLSPYSSLTRKDA